MLGAESARQHPRETKLRPNIEMGGRGAGHGVGDARLLKVDAQMQLSSKMVSRYFRPGMDTRMRKHPFYTTQ